MNTKEKILQKIEELEQLDNEYPKYMLATNALKCKQFIVKFTDEHTGTVVAAAEDAPYKVGGKSDDWVCANNTDAWKEITNPNELYDKDLIECWNTSYTCTRHYKFYDANNKCTFSFEGKRYSHRYDNYRKLMPWEYPEWAIEAQKTLED